MVRTAFVGFIDSTPNSLRSYKLTGVHARERACTARPQALETKEVDRRERGFAGVNPTWGDVSGSGSFGPLPRWEIVTVCSDVNVWRS